MYAKYYGNLTMLSKVTAKNVGDVFLRHTVVCYCNGDDRNDHDDDDDNVVIKTLRSSNLR